MKKLLVILTMLGGCQTTYRIETNPAGATVVVNNTELGQTPITISREQLAEQECYTTENLCLLTVAATGYSTEWVAISPMTRTFELKIELSTRAAAGETVVKKVISQAGLADLQAEGGEILRLQTLLFENQSIPLTSAEPLIRKYPNVAAVNFLYGMALYQTGESAQAIQYMQKAQEIAPQEIDYRVIAKRMTEATNANQ